MNEWCAETAMHKVMAKATPKRSPVSVYQYSEGETIPEHAWEDAMYKAIELVKDVGSEFGSEQDFIDLFTKAEQYYEASKEKISDVERMHKISRHQPYNQTQLLTEKTL